MKIQSINSINYVQNRKNGKTSVPRINNVMFKAYKDSIHNALRKNVNDRADIANIIIDLYNQLKRSSKIGNSQFYKNIEEWICTKPTYFIQEICKPTAEINSIFRDLIFKSKDENISILKGSGDDEAFIINFGKHGFFSNLFESEYAKNDMRLVFSGDEGTIELGTTKDGKISFEQFFKSGYWKKSLFSSSTGNKISEKTGDASEPVIW